MQEPGHGIGGNFDAGLAHQLGDLPRRLARPPEAGNRVADRIML